MKKERKVIAQGNYVPATRVDRMVYTAGMTPRVAGKLVHTGKIYSDESLVVYKSAVRQAVENAFAAAESTLIETETIERVVTLTVYVNAVESFTKHSLIADYASEYLFEQLGENRIGARAAVGVASLPGNATVEIQITALIA